MCPALPFREIFFIQRHENRIFSRLSHCIELLQQELDKLLLAIFWNHRKTIDDYKRVQALLEPHFILCLKIYMEYLLAIVQLWI